MEIINKNQDLEKITKHKKKIIQLQAKQREREKLYRKVKINDRTFILTKKPDNKINKSQYEFNKNIKK